MAARGSISRNTGTIKIWSYPISAIHVHSTIVSIVRRLKRARMNATQQKNYNTPMSNRSLRKQRRMFQREYQKAAAEIADRDMNIFKIKPRWIPMRIYIFFMGLFIKIKRNKK